MNKIFPSLLFIICSLSFSQVTPTIVSNTSLAEKIYLQLDKDIYPTGSTIWFKAIVTNSFENKPTDLSGVLYVELINAEKNLIEKKLIKLDKGIGEGYLDLPENIQTGTYLIRAYTEWNRNFDSDFFFEKYVQVFSPLNKNNKESAISNVTLVKDDNEDDHLKAVFNPLALDELHKNRLQLYITIDNIKDSVSIKKEKDGTYQMDYVVPKDSKLATLELITSNGKTHAKTMVLDEQAIDLQFFPESGELVHGLPNKVGFKVLDVFGHGTQIEGDIIDQNNNVITNFKSNPLGMGSFELNNVDSNKSYYAKWNQKDTLYPLPKIAQLGNVLSVSEKDKNITVTTSSNYLKSDIIFLNVSFRGATLHELNAPLKNGTLKFMFSSNELPEGIVVFKMMDSNRQPVAERIYFNSPLKRNLNLEINTEKLAFSKRELTELTIETTNNKGEPTNANTSILVINKEQLGSLQSSRENIRSYFLMGSELKGHIENPGFYFNHNENRNTDLDALMLTQGWRHYKYAKPYVGLPFKPERSLSVAGHVTGLLSRGKRKPAEITMMTFGEHNHVFAQITDTLGNFKFDLYDEFGKDMGIVLQSAKKTGVVANYNFYLQKKQSPVVTFNHEKSVEKLDSIAHIFLRKEDDRAFVYNDFALNSGDILLDEVVIEAYKMTPNRKKVMERFGKPDVVIEGKDVAAAEKNWSFGLYSVLMNSFPDKILIKRMYDGTLYASTHNRLLTLVVIDGIAVRPYDYGLIESIPPSEVSSVELIEGARFFTSLFCDLFPTHCKDAPPAGNVIAIYTHAQQGLHGVQKTKGIMKTTIPVFSPSKEFYAPKYDNTPQQDDLQKPDLRSVLHWQPIITTDAVGIGKTSFYNADIAGEMMVVVESIAENGAVGYEEYIYEVE